MKAVLRKCLEQGVAPSARLGRSFVGEFGLWNWGRLHPDPLVVNSVPVLILLVIPALLMAIWLFWLARRSLQPSSLAGERGESLQSDSEQEST